MYFIYSSFSNFFISQNNLPLNTNQLLELQIDMHALKNFPNLLPWKVNLRKETQSDNEDDRKPEIAGLSYNKRASMIHGGGQKKRLSVTGRQGREKSCLWIQKPEFRLPVGSCSHVAFIRLLNLLGFCFFICQPGITLSEELRLDSPHGRYLLGCLHLVQASKDIGILDEHLPSHFQQAAPIG